MSNFVTENYVNIALNIIGVYAAFGACCILIGARIKLKKAVLVSALTAILSAAAFCLLINDISEHTAYVVTLLVPVAILGYFIVRVRGAGYCLTFLSAQLMIILAKGAGVFLDNFILQTVLMLAVSAGVIFVAVKFKANYCLCASAMQANAIWVNTAALCALFAFTYGYVSDDNINAPIQYLFLCMVGILGVCAIFTFALCFAKSVQSNYDEDYLRAQLALKSSVLQVQKQNYSLSYADVLTGIGNRTAYEKNRQAAIDNWGNLLPAVCFSIDINNLKQTNDTKGHAQGDNLICTMAQILRETFPDTPEVYRMGGDEFIIMGYRTTHEYAEERLIFMRNKISKYNVQLQNNSEKLYVAIGLAATDKDNVNTFDELVKKSDEDMYANKRDSKEGKMV